MSFQKTIFLVCSMSVIMSESFSAKTILSPVQQYMKYANRSPRYGDSVLEIIGLLLSIANIAVGESCKNSHDCCLCLHVFVCMLLCCVVRVCVCVISPPTRFININKYRCNIVYVCVYYVYVLSPIAVRESYCT